MPTNPATIAPIVPKTKLLFSTGFGGWAAAAAAIAANGGLEATGAELDAFSLERVGGRIPPPLCPKCGIGVVAGLGAGDGFAMGDGAMVVVRRIAFAFSVQSTPQFGQLTGNGIRPCSGSTSNLKRCPQSHSTLISGIGENMRRLPA